MLLFVLAVLNSFLGTFAADRASYILDLPISKIERSNYRYICCNKLPIVLIFRNMHGKELLHGISLSPRILAARMRKDMQMLSGTWRVFRLDGFFTAKNAQMGKSHIIYSDDHFSYLDSTVYFSAFYFVEHLGLVKRTVAIEYICEDRNAITKGVYLPTSRSFQYFIKFGRCIFVLTKDVNGKYPTLAFCIRIKE